MQLEYCILQIYNDKSQLSRKLKKILGAYNRVNLPQNMLSNIYLMTITFRQSNVLYGQICTLLVMQFHIKLLFYISRTQNNQCLPKDHMHTSNKLKKNMYTQKEDCGSILHIQWATVLPHQILRPRGEVHPSAIFGVTLLSLKKLAKLANFLNFKQFSKLQLNHRPKRV